MNIANAPCSWGVLEFELDGEAPDYIQVLDEMHAIGYTGTELGDWGFMPTDPDQLRAELASRELTLLGAFVAVALADAETHTAGEASALHSTPACWQMSLATHRSSCFRTTTLPQNAAPNTPAASVQNTD